MGVQDFDPLVQARVNRPQPFEQTRQLIAHARSIGFCSINVDLMYGLPLQTVERFEATLDQVDQLRPDRIALFGYAHMPSLKRHHKAINAAELPNVDERLQILQRAIERFTASGYVSIGLDHFALADDELTRARREGTLRRNFMGYTTCAASDVIGLGPSAISEIGTSFIQNDREVHDWAKRLEDGLLPCVRGWSNSDDDQLRGDVIQRLFCQLELDTHAFGREHAVDFDSHFAAELEALSALEHDGLVECRPGRIRISTQGQLLLRNIASVFDSHFKREPSGTRHSTAV
jgi:oxygen-independent coproporphyrinogen-3 oxidase